MTTSSEMFDTAMYWRDLATRMYEHLRKDNARLCECVETEEHKAYMERWSVEATTPEERLGYFINNKEPSPAYDPVCNLCKAMIEYEELNPDYVSILYNKEQNNG